MAASTLEHDDATPPVLTKGHGTAALGPSDSSDSGSDIQGGPGFNGEGGLLQPTGNTSDPDVDGYGANAGADIGDANLDSDTDRSGTGERGAVGRDSSVPTDTLLRDNDDHIVDGASLGEDADSDPDTPGELSGSADATDASISYRPARAGQKVRLDGATPSKSVHDDAESGNAGEDGKPAARGDIPLFDRSMRDDTPSGTRH